MSPLLSPYSEIDELGGGQFRHTQHIAPVAYFRNRILRPMDFMLGDSGDPNLTIGADEFVAVRFRNKLAGNSPVVHFGRGQSHVEITPLLTNNANALRVSDREYKFPNAWNNADLRLVYGGHYLAKFIELKTGHPATFSFRIDNHAELDFDTLSTPDFYIRYPFLEKDGQESVPLTWQKSTSGGKLILTANLPAGDWAGWTLDPTFTIQPDATIGKDTKVRSTNPTLNYGIFTSILLSAVEKALIRFDLSSISNSATCQSANLYVYQVASGAAQAFTVTVYAIASGNAAWVEGTKAGTLAGAGEPDWDALAADGAGGVTTAWAGSAGLSTSGTDYENASIGSFSGNRSDANGTEYAAALTPARIQACFGSPNTNYGKMLVPSAAVGALGSSDNATPANRPKIAVVYSLPGGMRGIITGGVIGSSRGIQTGGKH